jgi:hypothetical protein
MQFPLMTRKLAARLQGVLVAETIAGLTRAAQQAGNPYGIERREFGAAVAFVGRNAPPHGWWNRVVGFQPDDINAIDDIIAFYRDGARRCHIDLDPLTLTPEIGEALAARPCPRAERYAAVRHTRRARAAPAGASRNPRAWPRRGRCLRRAVGRRLRDRRR